MAVVNTPFGGGVKGGWDGGVRAQELCEGRGGRPGLPTWGAGIAQWLERRTRD